MRGMSENTAVRPATIALAAVLDVLLVVVFAAIGRASHDEAAFGPGLVTTAWPFVAALAIGWVASLAWRAPMAVVRTGIPVWLITVVGGMLLRAVSGQGTAVAFIIVATLTLALFLLGWRLVVTLVRRRRTRV